MTLKGYSLQVGCIFLLSVNNNNNNKIGNVNINVNKFQLKFQPSLLPKKKKKKQQKDSLIFFILVVNVHVASVLHFKPYFPRAVILKLPLHVEPSRKGLVSSPL